MPRYRRLFLPGVPLHIIHRGHDRQAVFTEPLDYSFYLENLLETKIRFEIQVYAYCLMTNHVHLVIAPSESTENVSGFMRILAARQTRHTNKLENRTGTLWEGRFKASLIDSEGYLLACCRYVDLNPVRAAMVALPEEYHWSSYRGRAGITTDELLDPLPEYVSLGQSDGEIAQNYRQLVTAGIADSELALIRTAVQRNQLTGSDRFRDQIRKQTGRRISNRGRGRPAHSLK